jgi:hypothetical protein
MKVIFLFIAGIAVCMACNSKKRSPTLNRTVVRRVQIKSALLAAPKEKRDSCTVYGYSADKHLFF